MAYALLSGGAAEATTFGEVELSCPIGGEKFKAYVMMSTSIFGQRLDFKPLPLQSIAPHPKCPNGFVLFQREFKPEELEELGPIVTSAEYQAMAKKDVSHFLAAYLLRKTGAGKEEVTFTLLNAMWECEDLRCPHRGVYLDDAAAAFDDFADELEVGSVQWARAAYLAAELQRQRGEFADAASRLEKLRQTQIKAHTDQLKAMKPYWDQVQTLIDQRIPKPTPFVPPEEKEQAE